MQKGRRLLGQVLKGMGLLHEGNIQQALSQQKQEGGLIGGILVKLGVITEEDLTKGLAEQAGLEMVSLRDAKITEDLLGMVPASTATAYRVVPFSFDGTTLRVALADPSSITVLDDLRFMVSASDVQAVLAGEKQVDEALRKLYAGREETVDGAVKDLARELKSSEKRKEAFDLEDPAQAAVAAPVVKLLNLILLQAVKDKASDVHFEPFEDEFKIRYRIDGVLYEMAPPPKELAQAVISRIKVMSNLDIAETRVPQDGRIELTIMGRAVDLRVSTLPTMFGESVVMRVLDRSVVSLDLENLGLRDEELGVLRKLNTLPNGIILVTGPTGSGKTTTLYSALREANDPEVKIITTEDPVEYDLEGIIQIQINDEIGLTYASCLRSILRQDPDKILVGEIRDLETASISVEASLTGHVVFSTLHTNDAPSAVTRMLEIGVEPFLIAATLEAVVAQRLVRRVCPDCQTTFKPDASMLFELGIREEQIGGKKFNRGTGCASCNNTGYRGRSGIFEIMLVNEEIKQLIMDRASSDAIRRVARKSGMRTLRDSGLLAIYDGTTTADEVLHETSMI
jgi:type IV pilus assembly protein PilB